MNSKKLITLLVLTTLLFSMIPFVSAAADLDATTLDFTNDDNAAYTDSGEKGHTIWIESSDVEAVASGYEVDLYWDRIQDWDGEKGHLNTTEADDDGQFEIWFDVPEAEVGSHNLWFTATDQETKRTEVFTVISDCDISTSSGLSGSKVWVDLWGFDNDESVAILFVESDPTGTKVPFDYDAYTAWTLDDTELTDVVTDQDDYDDVELKYDIEDCDVINIYDGVAGTADWNGAIWTIDGTVITAVTGTTGNEIDITVDSTQPMGTLFYADYQVDLDNLATENNIETYDDEEDDYDGTLGETMIQPGTVDFTVGTQTIDDIPEANGNLYWGAVDVGGFDYVTGEWNMDLTPLVLVLADGNSFSVTYRTIDDYDQHVYVLASGGETDYVGSYEDKRVTIPDSLWEGQYYVVGFDGDNNRAYDDFKIGATIILSEDEGDNGDIIEIDGEGFPAGATITVTIEKGSETEVCYIVNDEDTVDLDGEFEIEIVIPTTEDKSDDYEIFVTAGLYSASADFETIDLTEVTVVPDFGAQGSKFTILGENFPDDADVELIIELWDEDKIDDIVEISDDAETESDGTFEIEVRVPTELDDPYTIKVYNNEYNIEAWADFRIGTVLVLLSDNEGRVGEQIVLTGNGFTENGEWNATFGGITIFEEEDIDPSGRLDMGEESPEFFVPQLQPGEYMITVWDVEAELSVDVDFTITEYISLVLESTNAPNEYNVTFEAYNWPEVDGDLNTEDEIEFVLWNETDDWDMDVMQRHGTKVGTPLRMPIRTAQLNETGFMVSDPEEYGDAYWIVPKDDVLDKGTYWINATLETDNEQTFFVQMEFVIGDVHMAIEPRKATFRIGDTVTFNIEHTFGDDNKQDIFGGDLKIYDPDVTLYWAGDDLDTWSQVETWFEVPYSAQSAGGNPMLLLDDAPLGTWSYKWRDNDGDTIEEGTFNVEASTEDVIGEQIEDLNSAIDDLTSDISSVTDAIAGVQTNVNNAVQAANAAVEAANKAIEAVNAGAALSGEALEAANRAAEAAGKAQDAAGGLTTLVYGAIGASLVAALAAIVSLMQISRRIAG